MQLSARRLFLRSHFLVDADCAVGVVKDILLLDVEVIAFSWQALFADDFFNDLVVFLEGADTHGSEIAAGRLNGEEILLGL